MAGELEPADLPGYCLRYENFEVWPEKDDGSTGFASDTGSSCWRYRR
ncbi:hypothetical protein ABTX62_13860 [Streptomyces sp. NPDC096046]